VGEAIVNITLPAKSTESINTYYYIPNFSSHNRPTAIRSNQHLIQPTKKVKCHPR